MKLFSSFLLLGLFAMVSSSQGQGVSNTPPSGSGSATQDMVDSMSGIHRPTPTPGAATASAKKAGPVEFGLFKDAKGKNAATTFTPSESTYLVCANVKASKGDKLGVAWYSEGKSGKSKKVFGSENVVPNDGFFNPTYTLAPAKGGSSVGAYYAEVILNGKALKKLPFTVK